MVRKIFAVHATQGLDNIINIKVTKPVFGKTITVTIETHRPGILIGKHGKHIEEIMSVVRAYYKSPVELKLVDSDMFSLSKM